MTPEPNNQGANSPIFTPEDFTMGVRHTELNHYEEPQKRLTLSVTRMLHGATIATTEVGELMDQLKRHIFYGTELDRVNLAEELGDIMYGIAVVADAIGVPLRDIMKGNNEKLAQRYREGFSKDAAVNRDLDSERKILEEQVREIEKGVENQISKNLAQKKLEDNLTKKKLEEKFAKAMFGLGYIKKAVSEETKQEAELEKNKKD